MPGVTNKSILITAVCDSVEKRITVAACKVNAQGIGLTYYKRSQLLRKYFSDKSMAEKVRVGLKLPLISDTGQVIVALRRGGPPMYIDGI